MFLHRWTVYEDIVVCSYAMDRKNDAKSIKKVSIYLGISQNRVAYRMSNFTKLCKDPRTDWHCSRQERKVFDWLSANRLITVKPK